MKNKNNLPGFMSEMLSASGLTNYSFQSIYNIDKNSIIMQKFRLSGPFRKSSVSLGNAFECGGSCPDGKLLCKSDINCVCCAEGCIDIIDGGGVKCGTLN